MSLKAVKIFTVLLSLLALVVPSAATSAAGELQTPVDPFVSTEINPVNLQVGETALVSVNLNNVPAEGFKSAEFTCTYSLGSVEKSNIAVTELFGVDPAFAIHDPQNGMFIVAISGANSNRALTNGPAFTFSAKGLQAGQFAVQCTARVSRGDNVAIDIQSIGANLTVLEAVPSPTPFMPATVMPDEHEHATATSMPMESPTPVPTTGSVSGQALASKPVTVRLLDANEVEVTSVLANPDGTFAMTPLPGDYKLLATASGFLGYQGAVTITAGNSAVFPTFNLLAGDVDANSVIDQYDALTIGMNYTASTPEAADLNNDIVINFLDLELLAENYRQTGPTEGTASMLGLLQSLQKKDPKATGSPIPGLTKTLIAPVVTSTPITGPKPTGIAPAATSSPIASPLPSLIAPDIPGETGPGAPFAGAPLCPTHDPTVWHGLWDSQRGCHYDHEHGESPFTADVAAAFPGFNLIQLLGGVGIGHTNPSSPMENTHKHGGFKWDVTLSHSAGCATGPGVGNVDGTGVNAFVAQYHNFGDYSIEMEAHQHSAVILMRQCRQDNPNDYGYAFFNQLQDYGQRVVPYQGEIYPYPNTPDPAYPSDLSPYFSIGCIDTVDTVDPRCRPSRQFVVDRDANSDSTWVSRPQAAPIGSTLFSLLFRSRDLYQLIDWNDREYPFTFVWICSSDGGLTYDGHMVRCRWNNSTSRIHELHGTIPATWDNVPGFDSDPRVGRITAQGYVTAFGTLNANCTAAGLDCHPFKLVNAFTGNYLSTFALVAGKGSFSPENLPERDIYFCGGVQCSETAPGAVPSGWIGSQN